MLVVIPVGFCEVLHKGVTGPFLFVLQLADPLLIVRPLKPSQLGEGFEIPPASLPKRALLEAGKILFVQVSK